MLDGIIILRSGVSLQHVDIISYFFQGRWCLCSNCMISLNNVFGQVFCNRFFLSNICCRRAARACNAELSKLQQFVSGAR